MKRFCAFLLLLAMLIPFAIPAHAAVKTIYCDDASGNELTVPSGWKADEVSSGLFQIKFVPTSGSALMEYGSVDLWGSLNTAAQKKTPRSELNNDYFSKADIADIVGCKKSQIKMVTVDDTEYFQAKFQKTGSTKGIRYNIDTTVWTRIDQGWIYLYYFAGSNSSLYKSFKKIIGSATYGGKSIDDDTDTMDQDEIYNSAVAAYFNTEYSKAQKLFSSLSSYKDSSKYLRLIRIRSAGSNIGVGSAIYQKDCGLTQKAKDDIDAAAKDFYFADTADVLLCNPDVACYYLVGKWNGGSKCYIHFKMNNCGGTYNIGSKLSTNYQSTFSIFDGELRVDVQNTNKLTLYLTLTSPNTMEVYTYEKGCKTYTLKRS